MHSLFKTEEGRYVRGAQPLESQPESFEGLVILTSQSCRVFVLLESSLKLNITKDGM